MNPLEMQEVNYGVRETLVMGSDAQVGLNEEGGVLISHNRGHEESMLLDSINVRPNLDRARTLIDIEMNYMEEEVKNVGEQE